MANIKICRQADVSKGCSFWYFVVFLIVSFFIIELISELNTKDFLTTIFSGFLSSVIVSFLIYYLTIDREDKALLLDQENTLQSILSEAEINREFCEHNKRVLNHFLNDKSEIWRLHEFIDFESGCCRAVLQNSKVSLLENQRKILLHFISVVTHINMIKHGLPNNHNMNIHFYKKYLGEKNCGDNEDDIIQNINKLSEAFDFKN